MVGFSMQIMFETALALLLSQPCEGNVLLFHSLAVCFVRTIALAGARRTVLVLLFVISVHHGDVDVAR